MQPDLVEAHHDLGVAYAAVGEWAKAAAYYAQAIESQPLSDAWFQLACARLLAGDTKGYQELCKQVLQRAGATKDPYATYIASRLCMLRRQEAIEPAQLVRWAEQALASDPKAVWLLHALGAAHYRAGELDKALRRCRESLEADPKWGGAVLNWLVLAMTHQRLGHAEKARQWLNKAAQWRDKAPRGTDKSVVVSPANLHLSDWLEFNVLYREAHALLKDRAPVKSDNKPKQSRQAVDK